MDEHLIDTAVRRDPRTAPLCTGHKRDGSRCRRIAIRGKTKCRLHGGRSLSGAANGNFRHGRYSKDLPTQLVARYEAARANPRLLSLSDDVAVAEARLATLLASVETGESAACWQALRTTLDAFSTALAGGDLAAMDTHFKALRTLVERGQAGAGVWEDIRRVWETRCKLVQTEIKTLTSLQQMITVQQHMLMLGAVTEAVTQAVQTHADTQSGRRILMDIQHEFTRLATLEER